MKKDVKKPTNRRWMTEKDKKYLKDLEKDPEAAKWLREFENKTVWGCNDKDSDLIAPRTEEEKSEDYHNSYAAKNDVLNIIIFDEISPLTK